MYTYENNLYFRSFRFLYSHFSTNWWKEEWAFYFSSVVCAHSQANTHTFEHMPTDRCIRPFNMTYQQYKQSTKQHTHVNGGKNVLILGGILCECVMNSVTVIRNAVANRYTYKHQYDIHNTCTENRKKNIPSQSHENETFSHQHLHHTQIFLTLLFFGLLDNQKSQIWWKSAITTLSLYTTHTHSHARAMVGYLLILIYSNNSRLHERKNEKKNLSYFLTFLSYHVVYTHTR